MRWNPKQIVSTVAVLAALWVTTAQVKPQLDQDHPDRSGLRRLREIPRSGAQEPTAYLRWKNGDVLPGMLLESKPGTVRWASPHFSDDLVVDVSVLDSILLPKQSRPPTGAFRIGTVSDDVWTADLVGADDQTFLFSSQRYGQVRVNRDAVYTFNRKQPPNLVFDGSCLTAWELPREGEGEDSFLFGVDADPSWLPDAGGHLQTNRAKAEIFRAFDWPKRFEIDLEFTSTEQPGFVLALGKNVDEALRLETWTDELVVVQDKLFEPVMTIEKDRRDVRLRLAFDSDSGELTVFDSAGRSLLKLDGVQPTTGESGIFIRNRGQDLTVRRLSVYRQPSEGANPQVDPSKPRVHMVDGQVVYGRLFVDDGGAYVLDADGTRCDIDLEQIDRIVRPGIELTVIGGPVELTYADGSVLRGRVEQLNTVRVILRATFADEPVTYALAGASQLRLGPTAETSEQGEDDDQLFYPSGRLRGRISFDGEDASPIRWQPEGAADSVRLADSGVARVECSSNRVSKGSLFDTEQFPDVLHLKNGEVIPCQVSSYDEQTLGFQSPFITGRKIDSPFVRGIEFKPSKRPDPKEEPSSELDRWLNEIRVAEQKTSFGIDLVKLERALTVPRFNRDNPPSHLLVANTGDLKRGKLLGINGQTIQFDSKLRKLTIPINRVARVVGVSKPEENPDSRQLLLIASEPQMQKLPTIKPVVVNDAPGVTGRVRVTLADGSILVFEPLESKDGKLLGRSPIYGEIAVPVKSIHHLHFGDDEADSFKSVFAEWVVRPGKEPEFGDDQ